MLSSKNEKKGEEMGIETFTLDERDYKGNQLYHWDKREKGGEQRTHGKGNPRSIPLSLKRVSYTANQYPYP